MSAKSTASIDKVLVLIPKHQNLVIGIALAIGISFGAGLLVGEMSAEGKFSQMGSNYRQVPTALASVAAEKAPTPVSTVPLSGQINLNSASIRDLDSLPGIGLTYAQKIIDGRPYTAVSELASRKIVPLSTYNKIKGLLSVQ